MNQVAGIVVAHALVERSLEEAGQPRRGKELRDVLYLRREFRSAFRNMGVFLQHRATTRCVNQNSFDVRSREGGNVSLRCLDSGVAQSRVVGQGAAADLAFRNNNVIAGGVQQTNG